jgi:hypothetical protein
LKKIDEETDKVKKDRKNYSQYLNYLLKNHSPIKKALNFNVEEEIKKSGEKKTLLKLIKFYHPDANGVEEMKSRILIEEIAKRLNDLYSIEKERKIEKDSN